MNTCPTCNQYVPDGTLVRKRKVNFNYVLLSCLVKIYKHAATTGSRTFQINDINFTKVEYTRVNYLVRFGMLYKNEDMGMGVYGIPFERIKDFIKGRYQVAEYYWRNPITKENEMSQNRVYVHQIKKWDEQVPFDLDELEYKHEPV